MQGFRVKKSLLEFFSNGYDVYRIDRSVFDGAWTLTLRRGYNMKYYSSRSIELTDSPDFLRGAFMPYLIGVHTCIAVVKAFTANQTSTLSVNHCANF